jgi:2-haloacid dehalogenase
MRRFSAITFDCYGTLIDWETGILSAIRPLLARHGKSLDDPEILSTYATLESEAETAPYRPYKEILAQVVDGFGLRLGFTPGPEDRECLAASLPGWRPFDDTVDALRELKRHYRLGIISNVDDDLFADTAVHLGVEFDWVITAGQARAYKPSHAIFDLAFKRIGLARDTILHAAQSTYHDIVPARALGLSTVRINRRRTRPGSGATPPAAERPDRELEDLSSLAAMPEPI